MDLGWMQVQDFIYFFQLNEADKSKRANYDQSWYTGKVSGNQQADFTKLDYAEQDKQNRQGKYRKTHVHKQKG